MRTPTTIEALEGAIEMLNHIKNGGGYNVVDFYERVRCYEEAAREHHRLAMIEERNRDASRELKSRKGFRP